MRGYSGEQQPFGHTYGGVFGHERRARFTHSLCLPHNMAISVFVRLPVGASIGLAHGAGIHRDPFVRLPRLGNRHEYWKGEEGNCSHLYELCLFDVQLWLRLVAGADIVLASVDQQVNAHACRPGPFGECHAGGRSELGGKSGHISLRRVPDHLCPRACDGDYCGCDTGAGVCRKRALGGAALPRAGRRRNLLRWDRPLAAPCRIPGVEAAPHKAQRVNTMQVQF